MTDFDLTNKIAPVGGISIHNPPTEDITLHPRGWMSCYGIQVSVSTIQAGRLVRPCIYPFRDSIK